MQFSENTIEEGGPFFHLKDQTAYEREKMFQDMVLDKSNTLMFIISFTIRRKQRKLIWFYCQDTWRTIVCKFYTESKLVVSYDFLSCCTATLKATYKQLK